jgi:hypothetical protein
VEFLARRRARYARVLAWLFALSAPFALLVRAHPASLFDVFGTLALGFIGSLGLFLVVRARELRAHVPAIVLAIVCIAIDWFVRKAPVAELIGAAGIGTTIWVAIESVRKEEARDILRPALIFPLFFFVGAVLAYETTWTLPRTWDAIVYAADAKLPVHAFHVGRLMAKSKALSSVAHFVYEQVWLFILVAYLLQVRRKTPPATDLLTISVCVSTLGQIGYFLLPLVGPVIAFGREFPAVIPDPATLRMVPVVPPPELRNCMPSIHTAWALVLLWNVRPFGIVARIAGWFVLVFTILSTLGFGYHYVVDLVAAVPFTAAVQIACTEVAAEHRPLRARAVAINAALAISWPIALGTTTAFLPLVPVFSIVTLGLALYLEQRVARVAVPLVDAEIESGPSSDVRDTVVVAIVALFATIGIVAAGRAVSVSGALPAIAASGLLVGAALGERHARAFAASAAASAIALVVLSFASAHLKPIGALFVALPAVAVGAGLRGMLARPWILGVSALIALAAGDLIIPAVGVSDTLRMAGFGGLLAALLAFVRKREAASPVAIDRRYAIVAALAAALSVAAFAVAGRSLSKLHGDDLFGTTGVFVVAAIGIAIGLRAPLPKDLRGATIGLAALALAIAFSLRLWREMPDYLASFAMMPDPLHHEREITRFLARAGAVLPTSLAIGALASTLSGRSLAGPAAGGTILTSIAALVVVVAPARPVPEFVAARALAHASPESITYLDGSRATLERHRAVSTPVAAESFDLRGFLREDAISALATVRAVFPEVWVHREGPFAVVVACKSACPLRAPRTDVLLDPRGVEALLADAKKLGVDPDGLVATEDDPRLEIAATHADRPIAPVLAMLRAHAP